MTNKREASAEKRKQRKASDDAAVASIRQQIMLLKPEGDADGSAEKRKQQYATAENEVSPATLRTREQWAKHISSLYCKSAFELGCELSRAKKALPHGEFLQMIETDLPFSASTAQRLMKVAADPKLRNAAHAQHLPAAWPTLYELTKLDDKSFAEGVESGAINADMTRADAVETRKVTLQITHKPKPINEVKITRTVVRPQFAGDVATKERPEGTAVSPRPEEEFLTPFECEVSWLQKIEELFAQLPPALRARRPSNTFARLNGKLEARWRAIAEQANSRADAFADGEAITSTASLVH
jgi:hypothetical protein